MSLAHDPPTSFCFQPISYKKRTTFSVVYFPYLTLFGDHFYKPVCQQRWKQLGQGFIDYSMFYIGYGIYMRELCVSYLKYTRELHSLVYIRIPIKTLNNIYINGLFNVNQSYFNLVCKSNERSLHLGVISYVGMHNLYHVYSSFRISTP